MFRLLLHSKDLLSQNNTQTYRGIVDMCHFLGPLSHKQHQGVRAHHFSKHTEHAESIQYTMQLFYIFLQKCNFDSCKL